MKIILCIIFANVLFWGTCFCDEIIDWICKTKFGQILLTLIVISLITIGLFII